MATTKISVTVDRETLEKIKRFSTGKFNLSALVNEALSDQLRRHEMLAFLDEMDRDDPPSEADEIAGENLWQKIQSSSIQARSARSLPEPKRSASRRAKR